MIGSTNHVAHKKQESQRIKNCYNCDGFEMHHKGILCKIDGIVRDKEGALIGCKSHIPVPSSERAACCYSCDFLVSRNCKWECSHEGGRKEIICIDTEYCNLYSRVEPAEGEEVMKNKAVKTCYTCKHLRSEITASGDELGWFCMYNSEKIPMSKPSFGECDCAFYSTRDETKSFMNLVNVKEDTHIEKFEDAHIEKFMDELKAVLDDDFNFLVEKNRQYGDSALDPLRIFSQASTKEQIFVRLDDKLSRIKRGDAKIEDTFRDMRGYLYLLEVLERRERAEGEKK